MTRRSTKLCDYRGHACDCEGYKKAQTGSTLCVCGHYPSQHNRYLAPDEVLPPVDMAALRAMWIRQPQGEEDE